MLVRVDDEDDEEAYSDSVHSDSWMLRDESTVLRAREGGGETDGERWPPIFNFSGIC